MSNRLVLQDLVDLLAKKSKITKKEADSFFRELFQLILDRIFENDSVKIKDFGTFKLVLVSSRESVDVNTGEKIEIRAHSKFSFVPDKALKNLVNKPFSQFETILLEDEVDFDAPLEPDEDLDYEMEEKEYIMDIPQDAEREGVSEPENKNTESVDAKSDDLVQSEIKSNDINDDAVASADTEDKSASSPIQYPSYNQSFVYTYTTTSSNTSDSITITLPTGNLSGINSSETVEEVLSEVPVEKPDNIELINKAAEPEILNSETADSKEDTETDKLVDETEDSEEYISEEKIVVPEVITSLPPLDEDPKDEVLEAKNEVKQKRYIDPIVAATNDDVAYIDSDSEIETEEDVVLPPPIVSHIQRVDTPENINSVKSEQDTIKHKSAYSVEDPERPLFPDEDDEDLLTDDDFVELKSDNSEFEDRNETKIINHTGNNKPASIRSVSYTETIDDVEIPYHDYYAPTFGQKLKKALPWIILGLAVLGFIGYNIIPMFNVKYDYENKLRRVNLTTSDTLPLMDEEDSDAVVQTAVLLDSMKSQPAAATNADSVNSQAKTLPEALDTAQASHVPDRQISENLKIDVINKAQLYVQRYPAKQTGTETINNKETAKPTAKVSYDTIKRGVTLRNLSTKHYGNGDYWVYIYQANKAKIRNPNSVPIGTSLVMPALSTYGVSNPKDPKELQKAQNMAVKILR